MTDVRNAAGDGRLDRAGHELDVGRQRPPPCRAERGGTIALAVVDPGRDRLGTERRDADLRARAAELVVEHLAQRQHGVLAHVVGGRVRHRRERRHRRGVDDVTLLAALEHDRHERANAVDHAPHVDAEHPVVVLDRLSSTRARRRRRRRCCRRRGRRRSARASSPRARSTCSALGHVGRDREHLDAARRERPRRRGERAALDVGEHHLHALAAEGLGEARGRCRSRLPSRPRPVRVRCSMASVPVPEIL